MKANTLLQQLSKLLPLTSGNRVIPITSSIKFDGVDTFSATDMRNYMDVVITDTEIDTSFCVDASKLTNILKGFGNNEVNIRVKDSTLLIQSDKSKYKLPIDSVDDFPNIKGEFTNTITIDGAELQQAINDTSFATSRDELRPAMNGLYFNSNCVVATDAYKLVRSDYNHGLDFIMPISAASLINQNITESVNISDNDTHIRIELDNVTIHSRKIEEKYPNYEAVVPTAFSKSYKFNVSEMEQVVKRLLLTANNTTSAIIFDFNNSECKAYSSDVDFGVDGIEVLSGDYDGDDLRIGFNGKYLAECLRSINDDTVALRMNNEDNAGVIECNGKIVLLMPVRV